MTATIRKSIDIEVPVQEVFAFFDDPRRLLDVWPSMQEITNVTVDGHGNTEFDWVYKMAGASFRGHSHTLEVRPDRLRVQQNEGGIPSIFRWSFDGFGGRTLLTLEIEYALPRAILGRLAQPFVRKINEREADVLLGNIRARMEEAHRAGLHPPTQPHA